MITGLTNLGPSLGGMAGLGAKTRDGDKSLGIDSKKEFQASDFEKVLGEKSNQQDKFTQLKSGAIKPQALEREPEKVSSHEPKSGPWKDRPERNESGKATGNEKSGKLETTVRAKKNGEETFEAKENSEDSIDSQEISQSRRSAGVDKAKKINSKSATSEEVSRSDEQKAAQVMQQFMDSMESELGIPPEDIVEAMAELPTDQLLKSPESTASQVIDKLSLSEDEQGRAMELYLGMLQQLKQPQALPTREMILAGGFSGAGLFAGQQISNQQKREMLNSSLDQLNNQFFMRGEFSQSAQLGQKSPLKMGNFDTQFGIETGFSAEPDFSQLNNQASAMNPSVLGAQELAQENPQGLNLDGMSQIDPNSPEAKELLKNLAALSATAGAVKEALPRDPKIQQALKSEQIMNQLKADGLVSDSAMGGSALAAAIAAAAANESASSGGSMMNQNGDSSEDSSSGSGQDTSTLSNQEIQALKDGSSFVQNLSSQNSSLPQSQKQLATGGAAGAMGMVAGKSESMTAQQEAINAQRLMNQAQILLKKGGGEAKITMAPEGVGQIHMKMTLMDGRMNLEMQAESKEAKKLIESSIGELRTSLGHHNIAVDQIKVDLSQKSNLDPQSGNSQQQSMADSRQEGSKEQARNFWSQFGGGFDRRNQFNETTGIRAYGGQRRQSPLQAVDTTAPTAAPRSLGSGKGRGLNLVA